MSTNEAAERLRVSVEKRIAGLNPGDPFPAARRRSTKKWAEIHLRAVLDEALEALAEAKADGWDEGYRSGFQDAEHAYETSPLRAAEKEAAKQEGAAGERERIRREWPMAEGERATLILDAILDEEAAR